MQRSATPLPFLLALLAAGCATSSPAPRPPAPAAAPVARAADAPQRETEALLLLLADRRLFDGESLGVMLGRGAAEREALAVALGRIGDRRGRSLLQGLLVDASPAVRRAAAFALGELGAAEAAPALLRATVDDDLETGALAVEALGKLRAPLADVRRVLGALEGDAGAWRLAPFLFRFEEPALVDVARELLASARPELRAGAAYALGRAPRPEARTMLLELAGDADPAVRAAAARGLGEVGGVQDLAALLPLASDAAVSPRIQALRAGARILERVSALAPSAWAAPLEAALRDPSPGVRAAALEATGPFLPGLRAHSELEATLRARLERGEPRERELALAALVRGVPDAAADLVLYGSGSGAAGLRAAAATAAGAIGDRATLAALAADAEPRVRAAAIEGLAELAGAERAGELLPYLADPDFAVRATLLDRLAAAPGVALERLVAALETARADRANDARLAAIRAVAARAAVAAEERQHALLVLEEQAHDGDYLVRREAAAALEGLGAPRPEVGAIDSGHGLEWYREALDQTRTRPVVELETERGALRVRLECPEAPLTCLSFRQLAAQGYFDGLAFHRVVPDFVVQGGDPRGDGNGGPGYVLRDEINRLRYRRGAVGMALSGPDTGGSQFFVALSSQPHLDGGYTLFGTLIGSDAVLDELRQGDRILRVREVE